jgi:hypothetical protein
MALRIVPTMPRPRALSAAKPVDDQEINASGNGDAKGRLCFKQLVFIQAATACPFARR